MRLAAWIGVIVLLGAASVAGEAEPAPNAETAGSPFRPLEVYVDSGKQQLVAYQIEISYDPKTVKVLSLEGGEPKAFKDAPHYDPAGMTQGKIVIAAFTTDHAKAPRGKNRLARLHLMVKGKATPKISAKLITAAKPGGKRIKAKVELTGMGKTKKGIKE
jgi:hypothetical protein